MPWCEDCARFWNPNSMWEGGRCPTCQRVIADSVSPKAPWHFKLLVVAAAGYLGLRAWQGVVWVVQHV